MKVAVIEVGGSLIGLWPDYLKDNVSAVVIFLDASNYACLSKATLDIYSVVAESSVRPLLQAWCSAMITY
jgi:hypothetical protein